MGNSSVDKKVNTSKVNTWVNTFVRIYPGCLKELFTFGIRFLPEPWTLKKRVTDPTLKRYSSKFGFL